MCVFPLSLLILLHMWSSLASLAILTFVLGQKWWAMSWQRRTCYGTFSESRVHSLLNVSSTFCM